MLKTLTARDIALRMKYKPSKLIHRSLPKASAAGKSGASSAQARNTGKFRENHKLGILAEKLFDEKVPIRKKTSHATENHNLFGLEAFVGNNAPLFIWNYAIKDDHHDNSFLLKLFRRLATVKDDGTVQFEVPGDIQPPRLDFGTGVVHNEVFDEEPVDTVGDTVGVHDMPPCK
ncbi:unnamed protein product [Dovyalis caffra]|uniref:Uncharacterized protein n=1 Tax=Dovyalis caffra TaxID=77055 RepID=A0AAV1RWC7_9ROSI|nr:unnamed protein product [Dovyalis caffra]